MSSILSILLLSLGVLTSIYLLLSRRSRRRKRILASPLPAAWRETLEEEFPRLYGLPDDLRKDLVGCARILAEEKSFEACGGLPEVTERMQALICIQAALLIVRLPGHRYFPRLRSILVYPSAFRDRGHRRFGLHEEDESGTRLGESWDSGSVILSWESVKAGAKNADDGMNVAIHEFAHQLDQINGAADGLPILKSRKAYRDWAEIFLRSYEKLVEEVNEGKGPEPLIDPYGATDPAEFFAVASETFFEEARELKEENPDLYEQLSAYYQLDPASWDS